MDDGIASSINQQMEIVFHIANYQYPIGGYLVISVCFFSYMQKKEAIVIIF